MGWALHGQMNRVATDEANFKLSAWCFCYTLSWGSLDLEFGFGFGGLETGVGMDRASASGSLHQLCFCVWYLAMGGGHVTPRNGGVVAYGI